MKSLYESILDDEDVLIGNTKDDAYARTLIEKIKKGIRLNKDEVKWCSLHTAVIRVTNEQLKEIIRHLKKINSKISLNWIDVSRITDMSFMFYESKFNGDISKWDVSKVKNMYGMFWSAKSFNQPIGDWDVSKVINMSYIFRDAESFNQPIGDWNVSNVTDMLSMFEEAYSFNQPIGDWDVSNVNDVAHMFSNAESFNQDLSKWKLKSDCEKYCMFSYCRMKQEFKPKGIE